MIVDADAEGYTSSLTLRHQLPCGCTLTKKWTGQPHNPDWAAQALAVIDYWLKKRTGQHRCGTPDRS